MSPETIVVENLSKTYQVPEREGGFGAAVGSFFKRKYKDVKAVQKVDFKIAQGEVVGFLGPEWRRENHHAQNALRSAPSDRRHSPCARFHTLGAQA